MGGAAEVEVPAERGAALNALYNEPHPDERNEFNRQIKALWREVSAGYKMDSGRAVAVGTFNAVTNTFILAH